MHPLGAVFQAAEQYATAGLSVIPIKPDGSKRPVIPWKEFQSRIAGPLERSEWWANGSGNGIAIIAGEISDRVEVMDFDDIPSFKAWGAEIKKCYPELVKQLVVTETPGPGMQVIYRTVEPPGGNQVLARGPDGQVRIETRGEGGYFIAPPSGPDCHPNHKPYVLRQGSFAKLPVVDPEHRSLLLDMARALDGSLPREPEPAQERDTPQPQPDGGRPGDDYNARGDWADLLLRASWQCTKRRGSYQEWKRPGDTKSECSATIGGPHLDGHLHVFSTNAAPFEAGKNYSLFYAYALLNHGGDCRAAAKELASRGYGEQRRAVTAPGVAPLLAPAPGPTSEIEVCRTDLGNAVRLVRRYHEHLRHAYGQGWMSWSGKHWAPDRMEDVLNYAKETARSILGEAATCPDKEEAKKLAAWSFSSRSSGRVHAMLDLAKSEPAVRCAIEEFDQDIYLFNCANGTLDLRTGAIQPHRREDLISHLCPMEYDPGARLADWDEFLLDLTGQDAQFASFLQRAVGLSLSGDTSDSALFFALGPTGTGKSTFLAAIGAALGTYAASAAFDTFLVRERVGAPRPDLARLRGKRLVTSVETEQGRRFASGLMKQLTGDDMLVCRFLHVNEIEYRPQFKIWLAANDAPEAPHDDDGFWRRLYRLPFIHRPSRPNPKLKVRLRQPDAGAAILAWAVDGFREWQQQGLGLPEAIRAATAEYRNTMDPLAGLFPEYLRLDQEERATAAQIKEAYWKFVQDNDIREPLSAKALFKLISSRPGAPRLVHTERGNIWQGIGIVAAHLFDGG